MRFQRILGAAACCGLAAGPLGAQEARAPVGIEIGYSRSDLGGRGGPRLANRQGALAGVYLTGRLSEVIAIQSELMFALKGGRTIAELDGGPEVLDIELAYLELPILARLSVLPSYRQLHPVVFGGVAPAVRIGCDFELVQTTPLPRQACKGNEQLAFHRTDVGAVVGAGVHFDWAETALGFEVRYTIGLRPVFGGTADVRNRQLGILLALNF